MNALETIVLFCSTFTVSSLSDTEIQLTITLSHDDISLLLEELHRIQEYLQMRGITL